MGVWFSLAVVGLCLAPSASPGQANLPETIGGCKGAPPQTTKTADPSNYLAKLSTLAPGEQLLLDPGTYSRELLVHRLKGGSASLARNPTTSSRIWGPPRIRW